MPIQSLTPTYITFTKEEEAAAQPAAAKRPEPGSTTAPGTSSSAGASKASQLRREHAVQEFCENYAKQFTDAGLKEECYNFYKEKFPSLGPMNGRPIADLLAELDMEKEADNPNIEVRNKEDAKPGYMYAVYEPQDRELRANRIITVEKQAGDHNGIPASLNQGGQRTVHIGCWVHNKNNPLRSTQYGTDGEPEAMEARAGADKEVPYMTLQPAFLNAEESALTKWYKPVDETFGSFLAQSLMMHAGKIDYSMNDLSISFAPHTIEGRPNPKAGSLELDDKAREKAVEYGKAAFDDPEWARNPPNLHRSMREGGSCSTVLTKHMQGLQLYMLKVQAEQEWERKGLDPKDAPTFAELVDKLQGIPGMNPMNQSPRVVENNFLLSKVNGEFQWVFCGKSSQEHIVNDKEGPPPSRQAALPPLPDDDPRTTQNVEAAKAKKELPRTEITTQREADEAAKGK